MEEVLEECSRMEPAYNLFSVQKGYVLIINNETFANGIYEKRAGSGKDFESLKDLFKHLGFRVISYYNLNYQQFTRVIKCFARMDAHWNMDSCILFIMTHGHKDKMNPHAVDLATTDNKYISTDWIKHQFNSENCKSLMNKPKILFFEACRTKGPRIMQVKRPAKNEVDNIPPHISDMLCIHSCLPGYEAFIVTQRGSCFVQELCNTVKTEGKLLHLITLLNKVDINLRKKFTEKSAYKQAVYIESWSFNKLMFLTDEALNAYKATFAALEGKQKKEVLRAKPPASRPILITREEILKALKDILVNRLLPYCKEHPSEIDIFSKDYLDMSEEEIESNIEI